MIKWHEYTWYSKTLAVILFIFILPPWIFYLGMQYESTREEIINEKLISYTLILDARRNAEIVAAYQNPNPKAPVAATNQKHPLSSLTLGENNIGSSTVNVLFTSKDLVQETPTFSYNNVNYRLTSKDDTPDARQAPILYRHLLQYFDPTSSTWIDMQGQSELGDGYRENAGLTAFGYKDGLFIISTAREGYHSDEIIGFSGLTAKYYKYLDSINVVGLVEKNENLYIQTDGSTCLENPDSCAMYYLLDPNGGVSTTTTLLN